VGIFSALFKHKDPQFSDRVWTTVRRKLEDLAGGVAASRASGAAALVVFHFRDTGSAVAAALESRGVPHVPISDFAQILSPDSAAWREGNAALLLSAGSIPMGVRTDEKRVPKDRRSPPLHVHTAEHHPMPERDRDVLSLDRCWPMPTEFRCYTALEEPWMARFCGEATRKIMGALGMDENTCIEHSAVAASIRSAQEKLAAAVGRDLPADSIEDWARINLANDT
jgi:hypothetical protein